MRIKNPWLAKMAHVRHGEIDLITGSCLFHDGDDDDVNLWQLGLFAKTGRCVSRFITIVMGVCVCNDNVAMLAPIKILRLNRPTRRDACAISAHNQVCCRTLPVYPGAPDRQNQVTQHMSAKLSLVAGSWLFHDDDDDDANLWQLGLFAKIGRCVSRFIKKSRECMYVTKMSPCSRCLRLSKFSGSIGPPA